MPDLIGDSISFAFLCVVLAVFGWIALDTLRALNVIFLGQRTVRSLSDGKIRLFRVATGIGAIGVAVMLVYHLIR